MKSMAWQTPTFSTINSIADLLDRIVARESEEAVKKIESITRLVKLKHDLAKKSPQSPGDESSAPERIVGGQ
jgi:hypothetical protein